MSNFCSYLSINDLRNNLIVRFEIKKYILAETLCSDKMFKFSDKSRHLVLIDDEKFAKIKRNPFLDLFKGLIPKTKKICKMNGKIFLISFDKDSNYIEFRFYIFRRRYKSRSSRIKFHRLKKFIEAFEDEDKTKKSKSRSPNLFKNDKWKMLSLIQIEETGPRLTLNPI